VYGFHGGGDGAIGVVSMARVKQMYTERSVSVDDTDSECWLAVPKE
jgi:hypothetical protein